MPPLESSTTASSRPLNETTLNYSIYVQDKPKGTNYKIHSHRDSEIDRNELRPLIKGGGVRGSDAGCWDRFQGWNVLTIEEIVSSFYISNFSLWVLDFLLLFQLWL